jgi:GT2 family glycosyltransferase
MTPPRLSIITAIHNGLPMNRFYWETLSRHTRVPFELIVVDNHSTDGSDAFFRALAERPLSRSQRVVYVRNEVNHSYPVSQNQGLQHASADILCFLNNDVWLPRRWHERFEALLAENPYRVLCPTGQEAQPTRRDSRRLKRRWRRVEQLSYLWKLVLGKSEYARLWKAMEWMYGDLEQLESRKDAAAGLTMPGMNGCAVVFHRALLSRVPGIWDERFHAADWHLYLTLASLHERDPDIPLPQLVLDCYVHHFMRYTERRRSEPIADVGPTSLRDHWGADAMQRLWWQNRRPAG